MAKGESLDIRIFISSPSDVRAERLAARGVIERLNAERWATREVRLVTYP
jgi:hypothetical protein